MNENNLENTRITLDSLKGLHLKTDNDQDKKGTAFIKKNAVKT